jgi:uncharacterized membrane protein YfcA
MESVFLIIFGVILFYIGLRFWLKTKHILINGLEAEGVVFDLVDSVNIKSRTRYPIIRFLTLEKEWVTEKYSIGIFSQFLKVGQKVTVIYSRENPKEFVVKSRSTTALPIVAIALAVVALAVGLYRLHLQF